MDCGYFGAPGIMDACCVCGGGTIGWFGGMLHGDIYGECQDDMWTDDDGDYCNWYDSNPDYCGYYGEGAWDACCACGGGNSLL